MTSICPTTDSVTASRNIRLLNKPIVKIDLVCNETRPILHFRNNILRAMSVLNDVAVFMLHI